MSGTIIKGAEQALDVGGPSLWDRSSHDHSLTKEEFKRLEPRLREELLEAQFELAEEKKRAVLILVNGPDGAGKGAILNLLFDWFDARRLKAMTYGAPSDAERARPPMWKYWRDLPPKGEIGIVLGSWYHDLLLARARGKMSNRAYSRALAEINRFEAMLAAEGVILLKLWLSLDPDEAKERLKRLKKRRDVDRPIVEEWGEANTRKRRRRLAEAAATMIGETDTRSAPWINVPAGDDEYRDAAVCLQFLDALRRPRSDRAVAAADDRRSGGRPSREPRLADADFSLKSPADAYESALDHEQRRIAAATSERWFKDRGLICVFEGSDAAGKSSAIKRLRHALDPRQFRVHPIAAPTDEERARPYLWRFWRRAPARGHIAIFDRSWYGRVLVERVEGFCAQDEWCRAYGEINDFEKQLHDAQFIVVKFWLAISPDEQLRRFKEREETPYKHYKLTPDDWRNREKRPLYDAAVDDIFARTSTRHAPWTLIEAEDKRFARVKILRTIADRLENCR